MGDVFVKNRVLSRRGQGEAPSARPVRARIDIFAGRIYVTHSREGVQHAGNG